jgi:hypothetical protein
MPDELQRRTVLGAAWAAPVLVTAAAAPLAAASETATFSFVWSPERSAAVGGTLVLSITLESASIPSGGAPLRLEIAPVAGASGEPGLIATDSPGPWVPQNPGTLLPTAVFTADLLENGTSSVEIGYLDGSGSPGPASFQATITRGGALLAVSQEVRTGQPWIDFDEPSYTISPFGGTVVSGHLHGGVMPSTAAQITFSLSTASFSVTPVSLTADGTFNCTVSPDGFIIQSSTLTASYTGYESGSTVLVAV